MIKLKHSSKGFTLVEVMIAAAILVLVIAELLCSFTYCMLLNESNNNLVLAINDAQYVLEDIKVLPYADIASYTPPVFNHLDNEVVTLNRNIGPNISEITATVTWNERERQRTHSIFTRIAK